ncbi:AraC family transcriptional regulator ['Paenibacillus yunnanensis' Narsing Rao et al. 2020]|uniref:AraC family transcriptional regulator n=1 Tax=Paenibacillus tengchongensis TaxID=2608684 RepID=UPI00124F66B6|nr:AraC family transcriptional regulator [Paenibacillus tengchongensis]
MSIDHYQLREAFNLHPDERDFTVLFAGEARPRPGHKIGPSIHEYYLIHTVLEGEGLFQSEATPWPCRAGDTFVIFPGSLFSYQADQARPWCYAWIALQGDAVSGLLKAIGISKEQPVLHSADLAGLQRLYEHTRLSFRQSPYPQLESLEASGWARLILHKLALANLGALSGPPGQLPEAIDRQIDQAIRWLTLQFHRQISIDHMAATLGYHRAHLSKAFKQRTGMSPKQFLLHIRMDKAKELLHGSWTIDSIASSVGFNDALYFSKQFRKYTGLSPSGYRSRLRRETLN